MYYSEISIEIIEKLLKYPQFSSVSQKEAISFVQTKTQNDFTVAYNILYDSESKTNTKKKNKIVFPNKKKYEKSKPKTNKTLNTPSNWVYGFRCNIKARTLMERLYETLKDLNLEWKIIDNFLIRVRAGLELINGVPSQNYLRFDIRVYKVSFI